MRVDFSAFRSIFYITVFSSVVCSVMLYDFATWFFLGHSFMPEIITVPAALASCGTALCGLAGMRYLNRR